MGHGTDAVACVLGILAGDEMHHMTKKPRIEADRQSISCALVAEVAGNDQPMGRSIQTVEHASQRCANQVVANEYTSVPQHTRHLGNGALPINDVMKHQAADDGVE
jgi:hypothetical protein